MVWRRDLLNFYLFRQIMDCELGNTCIEVYNEKV